jgi:hypothetical protein
MQEVQLFFFWQVVNESDASLLQQGCCNYVGLELISYSKTVHCFI